MTEPKPFKWPTLGDCVTSWEGTCDRCGKEFPSETRILARFSPTRIYISCDCSPAEWIELECQP